MRRPFVILAVVVVGATLLQGSTARATCCQADADCPRGFACDRGVCAPLDCTCDSDCGPNLFCLPAVATVCTQEAGGTTQSCHPVGQCATAWQRPCATTADCGPGGFTCVANGQSCDNGGCRVTSTCMPPTLPPTCNTDADCPAAWACEPDTAYVTACIPEAAHSCPAGGCEPKTPTGVKSCVAPLLDLVGNAGFVGPPVVLPRSCGAKSGGGGGGGGASGGGAGAPGSIGGSSGAHGSGNGGASASAGAPGDAGSGQQPAADANGTNGKGCQFAPGEGVDPTFLLGFLGFGAVNLRRRGRRSGPTPRVQGSQPVTSQAPAHRV
jgi:hypothetical protein